jgi:AraC-like DNA-binding protein
MLMAPASTYRELPPPPQLAPYVSCIWVQEVGPGDGVYRQPVLPVGAIDLEAFDDRALVAGPGTRPTTIDIEPGSVTVGARFRPGAAPPLLGTAAADLRNLDVSLDGLWAKLGAALAERLGEAQTADDRVRALVDGLTERAGAVTAAIDPAAMGVVKLLEEQPGASLPWLADRTGLSERQLRRRVESAVGYPPRTLARILRFQRFLALWRSTPPEIRDLAGLATVAGYADQAHLTRESRRLGGLPPGALLDWERRRLSPGDDSGDESGDKSGDKVAPNGHLVLTADH